MGVASFSVRFYQRNDRGRLRLLKTVPLPVGTLARAAVWAGQVLEQTGPELAGRVAEVRIGLVEASAPSPPVGAALP